MRYLFIYCYWLGSADYYAPRQMFFLIGARARKACSMISVTTKTLKDVEDLKLELSLQIGRPEFLIIHPNVTHIKINPDG